MPSPCASSTVTVRCLAPGLVHEAMNYNDPVACFCSSVASDLCPDGGTKDCRDVSRCCSSVVQVVTKWRLHKQPELDVRLFLYTVSLRRTASCRGMVVNTYPGRYSPTSAPWTAIWQPKQGNLLPSCLPPSRFLF